MASTPANSRHLNPAPRVQLLVRYPCMVKQAELGTPVLQSKLGWPQLSSSAGSNPTPTCDLTREPYVGVGVYSNISCAHFLEFPVGQKGAGLPVCLGHRCEVSYGPVQMYV